MGEAGVNRDFDHPKLYQSYPTSYINKIKQNILKIGPSKILPKILDNFFPFSIVIFKTYEQEKDPHKKN